ncbi:MAG: SCP2 sterol-binding domain-containing protein [Thermoleophilia bacterium]|nr:SCP2 sterol-binding domain-containing protein [Thermoleophilia bacterium]
MTDTQTVADVMQEMQGKFKPEKAAGMTETFQFDITGDGGGQWYAKIADGSADFGEGTADDASVTITASDQDWIKIVNGQLNPQMAFMTGKIKVKGNIGLATKLGALFL